MAAFDRSAFTAFLGDLYAESVGADHNLILWTARDKQSTWVQSIDDAGGVLDRTPPSTDLYYGVCLQDQAAALEERRRRNKDDNASLQYARGYASTAAVMPGLWLDLDIAGPGHEKRGLPTNQVDAERILSALPYDPTWVVETGGGTHVYWLWREPWILESDEERERAAAVIRGWQQAAIDAATELGFVVDSTHDLSRVLRPVGTINSKYSRAVCFRQISDARFNPSDFDDWAAEIVPLKKPQRMDQVGEIRSDMQPPAEKLMAMLNLAPKFAETWKRERKEFPSQSEYDLSLASMAARAEWKDDEIVALVVTHRRGGGEDLKLDRPGYYARLLSKARAGMDADQAHERLADRVEMVQQGDADIEDEREDFLRDVSTLLGFKIRRIIKFLSDPPQYRLVLEEGQIHLGGVESILTANRFRASIAAVAGHLIQRFTGARWDPVAQAILQAVEELDLGADSTVEGVIAEWLGEYLSQHRPSGEPAQAIQIRYPFVMKDGRLCFFLAEFRSWLSFHRDERLGRKELATLLRTALSEPVVVNYIRETDQKKTTVSCWTVPQDIALRLPSRGMTITDGEDKAHNVEHWD
jgi:hypothetical protein